MDPSLTTLKIRSHNVNGYDNSSDFLYRECDSNSFSVLALQEHWLRPSFRRHKGTNKMKVLHPDFDSFATSAMSKQVGERVLKGRPFGGTGFLFHRNLSKCLRARVDIKCDRVTVMELCTTTDKILLINCYMPYFINGNNEAQINEYRDTVAFVENIMKSHETHKFILMMDMNCNIFNASHPYSSLINSIIDEYDLLTSYSFMDNFDSQSAFTRFDIKRNSYTLIDGIFISRSLAHIVQSSSILNPHDNVSDHLPLEIVISIDVEEFSYSKPRVTEYIPWSKLSQADIDSFQSTMLQALNSVSVPVCALNHCDSLCDSVSCIGSIEKYYHDIISCIAVADKTLPRRRHGFSKPYWSPELTDLKQKSYDAHRLWLDHGRPRSGAVFHEKRQTSLQYKLFLRRSKKAVDDGLSDDLTGHLINNDNGNFWRSFSQINGKTQINSSVIDGFIDHTDIANAFSSNLKRVYTDSPANQRLKNIFHTRFHDYCTHHSNDNLTS